MGFRRGGPRTVRGRGPRRSSEWVGSADQGYLTIGAGASVLTQSFAIEGGGVSPSPTLVRTRGVLSVRDASTPTADKDFIGAMGMCVVSDEAVAAGAASIPGPWNNSNWDGWFVWIPYTFRIEFSSVTGIQIPGSVQIEFDSKAMRKVKLGDTVVVMIESEAASAAAAVSFRQLYKLS